MANDSRTQFWLAQSEHFRSRLASSLVTVAWQVLGESPSVQGHAVRAAYARQVIDGPANYAARLAAEMSMRTNVFAAATSFDYSIGAHVTAATDAAMESQLSSDWNSLSGAA